MPELQKKRHVKKELKESILAFIEEACRGTCNVQLADELRTTLNRKRGRQPGTKYPRFKTELSKPGLVMSRVFPGYLERELCNHD